MPFLSFCNRPCLRAAALFAFLLTCHRTLGCDSAACTCPTASRVNCLRQGSWFIAVSDNFHVCSLQSRAHAEQMALHCEKIRTMLVHTWHEEAKPWNPKCQVVMHATTTGYTRATGRGSETTLGSSLVQPSTGPVRTRRIDLRTNVVDYETAALPHEMCHVVLADRFRDSAPPLWFDEGVALLYDPREKQQLHDRDLHAGLQRGIEFPLSELLDLQEYPSADRWGVFYGQSAALVRMLLTRRTAKQLLTCVEQAPRAAVSMALREEFGHQGWPALVASTELAPTLSSTLGPDHRWSSDTFSTAVE